MTKRTNRIKETILKRSTFIIFLILILGAFGLLRVTITHKDIDDVANIDLPLIELLTEIETHQLEQAINFERAIRYAEEMAQGSQSARQGFAIADSTFRYLAELVDVLLLDVENEITEALRKTSQETQRIKLKGLLLSIKKLESDHTSYENHALEVMKLLEEGKIEEAIYASDRVEDEEDQFNKQVEGVLMRHEMFTEALVKIVEQEEVLSMKWIVTLTLLFIILSLIAVYTFSYKIWRPLEDIRTGAEKIGQGDLGARISLSSNSITSDIVEAFNEMAQKLEHSKQEIDAFIHFSYSTADVFVYYFFENFIQIQLVRLCT
jgi:methyl-accepting chemotaxis protein